MYSITQYSTRCTVARESIRKLLCPYYMFRIKRFKTSLTLQRDTIVVIVSVKFETNVVCKLFVAFPFFGVVILLTSYYIYYMDIYFKNFAKMFLRNFKIVPCRRNCLQVFLLASNIAYKHENLTALLKILLPLEAYQRVITLAQYRVYLFIQRLQT